MDISEILPGRLYAGAELDAPAWDFIRRGRIDTVIGLQYEKQDRPPPTWCGKRLIWCPIVDAVHPGMNWLKATVGVAEACLFSGESILVHCAGGVSRTALVVLPLMMRHHGWTLTQTLDWVRDRRPVVAPNGSFLCLLDEYEQMMVEDLGFGFDPAHYPSEIERERRRRKWRSGRI